MTAKRTGYGSGPAKARTNEQLRDVWLTWERNGYVYKAAAEALGIDEKTVRRCVDEARTRLKLKERRLGDAKGLRAEKVALPKKGRVNRFILTCLQNNTKLHKPTWETLNQLAGYYGAEIKVSTFTYAPTGSSKRGARDAGNFGNNPKDRWYDIDEEFISDEFLQLAPGLVWCGHSNRLPTAVNPLSGVESINGRNSGVWPHTTIQMRPVPTMHGDATKFNWTTGTIGLKNYLQTFSGQRGEFHHAYGALLVEVCSDGAWFCRQLNADSEGTIYDLDIYATPDGVWANEEGCEALVGGDIHRAKLDDVASECTFGEGRMVDVLKPKLFVYHDLFDSNARRHWNRKNPHERFKVYVAGQDSVLDEVQQAGRYLLQTQRPWMKQLVIKSNHDADLDRFLRETDWRDDLVNAEFYLEMNRAVLRGIRIGAPIDVLAWAIKQYVPEVTAEFNPKDKSYVVCKKNGGGIELGLHGDEGPNGAPGTPGNLGKIGRKIVIGDKHAPGIWDGCYVSGVLGSLEQGYNSGPSGWAHANVPVYPNGKRQVLLMWDGAYSADDYLAHVA